MMSRANHGAAMLIMQSAPIVVQTGKTITRRQQFGVFHKKTKMPKKTDEKTAVRKHPDRKLF